MKRLIVLATALALAACGGGNQSTTATALPTAPAGSVKAVPPPAGQDWSQTTARTAEGFVMGNPNAAIKLVEYGSRLCPTCGALARDGYQPLTDKYVKTGKVSFEFREFLVHGAVDVPPALIGTCVGPEPFFPLLEQMFANQEQFENALQKAPPAVQQRIDAAPVATRFKLMGDAMGLTAFAQARGVPAATAAACLSDTKRVDALTKQTQDKGPGGDGTVAGTPTLLINGKGDANIITWAALETALKRAGA